MRVGAMAQESAGFDALLDGLRAAADPSRLRLLAICSQGEWTVSELVQILGQSQPRISRHLKILAEAGLLDRFREGGWVFYRRAQNGEAARIARSLCRLLPGDDPTMGLDQRRLESVREVFKNLRETVGDDIASANIVISGKTSVVLRTSDQLIELMSRGGQGVLNILPLASVKADVDAGISSLPQGEMPTLSATSPSRGRA